MVASISFSPRSFFTNFSVFHLVKCHTSSHASQSEFTKSTLLDLFGRKSESGEKFHDYLHQNSLQGMRKRDHVIYIESAEELFEGRKQIYERVVAITDVIDRLWNSDVTEIWRWDQRIRDGRQVGWQSR